jgi:hypothetical protein
MTTLNEQEELALWQTKHGALEPLLRTVEAIVDARLANVETLRDDLLAFNPGHGDFLTAGKSLAAALASDPTHTQNGTQA